MSKIAKRLMWHCDFCDSWSLIFGPHKNRCRICGKPRSGELGVTVEADL